MAIQTIELHETAGEDALLRLAIPVKDPAHTYRVIVLIEDMNKPASLESKPAWPDGVFESIAGQWEGDFPEEYEGDFEIRESL